MTGLPINTNTWAKMQQQAQELNEAAESLGLNRDPFESYTIRTGAEIFGKENDDETV